jgi:hypothetical protein
MKLFYIALGCVFGAAIVAAGDEQSKENLIARGKYLVEEVAMCQECHTPRDDSGLLDRRQWLKGGPVFLRPAVAVHDWAERVPAIAGLPGWHSDGDVIYFLENGQRKTGEIPRPPMKRYHLRHPDAVAIVVYLRSLATEEGTDVRPRNDAVPPAR